eukprot:GGOE01000467.1.p1 GENE.GGOE01000467.1~~GGOE01000467.1.p1  ORF type:complete len:545 (-),score=64.97 GGOE01000467.1:363-1997(-)
MEELRAVQAATEQKCAAHAASLDAKRQLLRDKSCQLTERHQLLEQQQGALAQQHGGSKVKGTDKLKLNVGGVNVNIRRETLTQFPGTRLAALFSGRWESRLLRDKNNRIFLDVNPACFKKIVDYHNLVRIAAPDDPPDLPEVAPEERATLQRLLQFFGLADGFACSEIDSVVLESVKHLEALEDWLSESEERDCKLELLYRASRDGWRACRFHSLCDNQGPTVTVIRSAEGYIFGGYLDQPWNSMNVYLASERAFLFTMRCHAGIPPTKMPIDRSCYAAYAGASYGPTFGGGHDIYINDNAMKSRNSSINIGHSYRLPPGQSQTMLTGSQTFAPVEVEVFRLVPGKPLLLRPSPPVEEEWQTASFEEFASEVQESLEAERRALNAAEKQLCAMEQMFCEEAAFINFFISGDVHDIVDLDVCGEKMSVKRSTLTICPESALARQFDTSSWAMRADDGSGCSDSEDEGVMIEQSAYCFGKIIDQLRLRAIMQPGDPLPPPPSVVAHERKTFLRMVSYYFPGCEDFILTPVEPEPTCNSVQGERQDT